MIPPRKCRVAPRSPPAPLPRCRRTGPLGAQVTVSTAKLLGAVRATKAETIAPSKFDVGTTAPMMALPPPLPTTRYPAGQAMLWVTTLKPSRDAERDTVTRPDGLGAADAEDAGRPTSV